MLRMMSIAVAVPVVLSGFTPAFAQERAPAIDVRPVEVPRVHQGIAVTGVRVPIETRTVTGAPYMAELEIEHVQTLGDGNRIVNRTTGRVYRDAEGRTRREEDREPGRVGSISVSDPVANRGFSLDPETRTAWRTNARSLYDGGGRIVVHQPSGAADPAQLERRRAVEAEIGAAQGGAAPIRQAPHTGTAISVRPSHAFTPAPLAVGPGTQQTTEKLAAREVGGVTAEGTRLTRTVPAGAIGNEQPLMTVMEEWFSPELQVLVMTSTTDPRTGEYSYRLLNIVRTDPSPSLFDIPSDYTVRDSGLMFVTPQGPRPHAR